MIVERALNLRCHTLAEPLVANGHDRLKVVADASEFFSGVSVHDGRSHCDSVLRGANCTLLCLRCQI